MTTKELLITARARIADEQSWTQGESARDASGESVTPRDPLAVSWCAVGALLAVVTSKASYLQAMDALDDYVPDHRPIEFNDTHTHAEVLALFDAAIHALENAR